MTYFKKLFQRLRREDSGSVTIEFAIIFPVFLAILTSSIEMGVITIRQTMLERGLDIAMREVRIGTGAQYSHDDVRNLICEGAAVFDDCESKLRLELVTRDIRDYVALPNIVDCTGGSGGNLQSGEITPVRSFETGMSNELMMVRACMMYSPIFPTSGLGLARAKSAEGDSALVAVSAFVQEPR